MDIEKAVYSIRINLPITLPVNGCCNILRELEKEVQITGFSFDDVKGVVAPILEISVSCIKDLELVREKIKRVDFNYTPPEQHTHESLDLLEPRQGPRFFVELEQLNPLSAGEILTQIVPFLNEHFPGVLFEGRDHNKFLLSCSTADERSRVTQAISNLLLTPRNI